MSKIAVSFGNQHELYEFSLLRHLVQRFPPLRMQVSVTTNPDEFGRWDDNLLGSLPDEDRAFTRRLNITGVPTETLLETSTIHDALLQLDRRIIDEFRQRLPAAVVGGLTAWLSSQWSLALSSATRERVDWEEYFWRHLSFTSRQGLPVDGRQRLAPSLVGQLEVFTCGVYADRDGEPQFDWIHQRPTSLTDPLGATFAQPTNEDSRRIDQGESTPYIMVCYRGTSLATAYFERNLGFWSQSAAVHPRDHWAIRSAETSLTRGSHVVSRMLPTVLRGKLDDDYRPVAVSLGRTAAAVGELHEPLADPIWLDRRVQAATIRKNIDVANAAGRRTVTPRRNYSLSIDGFFIDLTQDWSPMYSWRLEEYQNLLKLDGTEDRAPLPVESWQEGILLPLELKVIRDEVTEIRKRALLERHLDATGIVEKTLRIWNEKVEKTKGITGVWDLMTAWMQSHGVSIPEKRPKQKLETWMQEGGASMPDIKSAKRSSDGDSSRLDASSHGKLDNFERVSDTIDRILVSANAPDHVHAVVSTNTPASTAWNRSLFGSAGDRALLETLFAAALLINLRNRFAHGVLWHQQSDIEHELHIFDYEHKSGFVLDDKSADQCLRLVVFFLAGFLRAQFADQEEIRHLASVINSELDP